MGGAECTLQSRRGGLGALAHAPRSQVPKSQVPRSWIFHLIMFIAFQDLSFPYHQRKVFVYIPERFSRA